MKIDAHHHYWKYNPVEYDWIDDSMAAIRADFLPEKLEATIPAAGVDGVVTVQARQLVEETDWLLQLAQKHHFMKGVVGWLPLIDADLVRSLEFYSEVPKLKGLRHVLQGEPDMEYMLRPDFNKGLSLLKNYDLVYDILIFERQLPNTIRMVDRHPNQVFVLDHIAKPLIAQNELQPWSDNLRELARRENVYCKLSGMVTEADFRSWTPEQLKPYFNVVLNAFGPNRLMWGSDWPVCLVATSYNRWVQLISETISSFSETEQQTILGTNAQRVYNLH
jgi:L-fuconolactonase